MCLAYIVPTKYPNFELAEPIKPNIQTGILWLVISDGVITAYGEYVPFADVQTAPPANWYIHAEVIDPTSPSNR